MHEKSEVPTDSLRRLEWTKKKKCLTVEDSKRQAYIGEANNKINQLLKRYTRKVYLTKKKPLKYVWNSNF